MELNEKESKREIQSLLVDYQEESKKSGEDEFDSKMNSLFEQLDTQLEKIKQYANINIPFQLIDYDSKYDSQKKDDNNNSNNKNNNNISMSTEKKVEISEIKEDEDKKKKMYEEMAIERMKEEKRLKEIKEIENKRKKNEIEEKKRLEEHKKKEEALLNKEKEIKKREEILIAKEKEIERKREEDYVKSRILEEELERLQREEEEREKEEKRESDRIREIRKKREKEEKEEEEKKRIEEEKKKEMEKIKKEQELLEEKILIDEINNQKKNNLKESKEYNELNIQDIVSDSIEELEYDDKKKEAEITNKSTNNQILKRANLINSDLANSINKSMNKFNNKNRNKITSPNKKNNIKEIPEKKENDREESEFGQNFIKSKIYNKLDKKIREKILECIYDIDDFDEDNPEYDDINIFPSITQFEKKEESSLDNLIKDFGKKFLEKSIKSNNGKEKYFNKEIFFEEKKGDEKLNELLKDIINNAKESHIQLLQKKYDLENLQNLPIIELGEINDIDVFENKLFKNEEFYENNQIMISSLENFTTFIYKYSLLNSHNLMVKAFQNFNYWRITLNDGNSFYRSIMFAIIEYCIINKNFKFLSQILNEISSDELIEYYNEKKVDYKKSFLILSAILIMIKNDYAQKAYEYLLKAYSIKNQNFDILLILYLKKILSNFAKEINKLLEEKIKSEDGLDIDKAKINIEQIEELYLEPPKFNIFYLISALFDINIKIFLVGGKFSQPFYTVKNIENEEKPEFRFGYFFSCFHILYGTEYNKNNDIFSKLIENDNPQIYKLTHILKDTRKCDMCYKDTKHIVFLKKKFIVCIPCLFAYVKEIIKQRSILFFSDNNLGLEFYTRPIHLQDEFYLNDFEYIEMFEDENIINSLFTKAIGYACSNCDKEKNENLEIITLDCKCSYCSACLQKILKNLSNNYGYLLPFETTLFNKKYTCKCEKTYFYSDLEKFINIDDEMKSKAQERLSNYIDIRCIICTKDLTQEEEPKKIKIRKENEFDKDHFICNKCYCKNFKDKDEDSDTENEENEEEEDEDGDGDKEKKKKGDDEIKISKEEHKIKCSLCCKWHHYVGNTEGCGCFIF